MYILSPRNAIVLTNNKQRTTNNEQPTTNNQQQTMKNKIGGILLGLAIALIVKENPVNAQDLSKVEIETIPVAEGIYMLHGEGGNIGVGVGEDGVFLIDDQFAPLTEKIVRAVEEVSDEPIRFLLNTHWHFDHTGGNENFGEMGTVIIAHDNVRKRMSVDNFIEAFNMEVPASPSVALPVVTFNDKVTLHLNGETIEAFHVSLAHTDGDTVIHFQDSNVIHAGDIFFNGFYPFIDVGAGGSIEGTIAAVDQILALANEDTKIIPGHGPLATRMELLEYRYMLVIVKERVEKALALGQSAEEFIDSNPTADLDKKWGEGFLKPEQFLQIVYSDLSN